VILGIEGIGLMTEARHGSAQGLNASNAGGCDAQEDVTLTAVHVAAVVVVNAKAITPGYYQLVSCHIDESHFSTLSGLGG